MFALLISHYSSVQIKEDEIDGPCGTYGGGRGEEEICIQDFDGEG